MPGIRVGYLVTGQHHQPLVERKLLSDLHVSTVSQAIVSEYLASGHYRHHLAPTNPTSPKSECDAECLQRHFPPLASWTVPNGGTFGTIARQSTNVGNLQALLFIFIAEGTPFFPGQQDPAPPEFYPLAR